MASTASPTADQVPMLLAGRRELGLSPRSGDVYNPSTGQVIAREPFCTAADADRAVRAAADALPAWYETPVVERARVLFHFRELLVRHAQRIASQSM
jgi:malonate-semialdehyde dehydrogenase (acetylating)/methylmalonate-semialdehyde dehydrogenase